MIKKLGFVTLLLLATACDLTKPATLDLTPPPGPPEYRQGWSDGCESGMSGYGTPFYKAFHSIRQDPNLVTNKLYYQTWKDAYGYCQDYVQTQAETGYGNRLHTW